ncbi:MAG: UDP-N-acetylglucosamine--N-acetylmuramyl-(pentapeptide) pyrophosphoryl-undecaprenol N-acetylglucosamine transferase [bacterium]
MEKKTHILMTGGGTLGPVTPLFGIVSEWQKVEEGVKVSWIGTPSGPEKSLVEDKGIAFYPLLAPKLDRHKWWAWVTIGPLMVASCIRAFVLLKSIKPDIVFTAGGYVSVPVVWMAKLLRIPSWVHQLDVKPGIANRLMAPFAQRVSVTWEGSAKAFPARKTIVVGGLVRDGIAKGDRNRLMHLLDLDPAKPTVLVIGGGTGASTVNLAMEAIADDLLATMNVIHVTGKGKMIDLLKEKGRGYAAIEFLSTEMNDAYAAADVVVARAGMGTITELAELGKPSVILPIPDSHQLENAHALEDRGAAEIIWKMNPQILKQVIVNLINDHNRRNELGKGIGGIYSLNAAEKIVSESRSMV